MNILISNDRLTVKVDGITYDIRIKPPEKKICTFQDCLDIIGSMQEYSYALPTIGVHKQMFAAARLFVIQKALQGSWQPAEGDDSFTPWFNGREFEITVSNKHRLNPFIFESREIAQKAIDIDKNAWYTFFNVLFKPYATYV